MSLKPMSGVNRKTTKKIRQNEIIIAEESQKRMKIEAPETAIVAKSNDNFADTWESISMLTSINC